MVYFLPPGRAQPIRYLLEDLQVKYEENTINDFPEFFKSIKATLVRICLFSFFYSI